MAYVQKGNPFNQSNAGKSLFSVKEEPKIQQNVESNTDESPFLRKKSKEPRKTTKGKGRNFRTVKEGAGMTAAGVKKYRSKNPGSKLKTAVTGEVKKGSKAAGRRKSFCARSKSWTGKRGRAARRRWKC
jgi:hypothetical protein